MNTLRRDSSAETTSDEIRAPAPLAGLLSQLSAAELLQAAEGARRSGMVQLNREGRSGRLWLGEGRIVHAETDEGLRGRQAALDLVLWTEGRFEADFRPVEIEATIHESTSFLLLEAARRFDEKQRGESLPPFAALADPPPEPAREVLALHRSLTLLGVAAAYASQHLTLDLLAGRFGNLRNRLGESSPQLWRFRVTPGGQVALAPGGEAIEESEASDLVRDVSRWLLALFDELERALPGRFSRRRLRGLTEAIHDDLLSLGFLRELGFDDETETR